MTKTKGLRKQEALISEAEQLTDSVIKGIQEKKGHDIVVLDLRAMGNAVADFFIICHGDSATQVAALARSVEEEVYKSAGENPVFKEGFENAEWILLDYISVVVHIFRKEQRDFYGVERFWADAAIRKIG